MTNVKRYLSGVTTGYVYTIVTSIVALWLTPYTLSFVDRTHYGYYILLADILTWLNLLQLGVSGVFNSKAAMCIGRKDYHLLQVYTSTASLMQAISGVIILVIGICMSFFMDRIVDTTGISRFDVVVTFVIVSFTSFFHILKQPLSAILVANKQIHIDNLLDLLLYGIQVGLTVLFLNLGYGIISLAVSHLVAVLCITLVTYIRVKRLPFKLKLGFVGFDKKVLFDFLTTGIWFTVGGLGQIFIYKVDRFFIGSYISLSVVTSYHITTKLYDFCNVFFSKFVNISRPYISQLYAQKNMKRLCHLYDFFVNASIILMVFVCIMVYLVNQWFVGWWIKNDPNAYIGDKVSFLFSVSVILQAAVLPNRALLASTLYKVNMQGIARVVEGAVKFLLSLLMIRYWGIEGLLWASIISCLLCSTIWMNYLSNKVLQMPLSHQFKNYISYLSLSLFVVVYLLPSKWMGLIVTLAVYFVGSIIFWRFLLSPDLKLFIIEVVKRKNKNVKIS